MKTITKREKSKQISKFDVIGKYAFLAHILLREIVSSVDKYVHRCNLQKRHFMLDNLFMRALVPTKKRAIILKKIR